MWSFVLDSECKANSLTDEVLLTTNKLKVNGTMINSIKKENIFRNIVDKYLQMLKLMAKKNKFFNLKHLKTNEGNMRVCQIVQNKDNGFIFEVFRKLGFPNSSLTLGVIEEFNFLKVYTTRKLNRTLEKLNDSVKSQVMLYLLSITSFLHNFNERLDSIEIDEMCLEYSDFDNTVNILQKDFKFEDYMMSFTNIESIAVVDFDDIETISEVQFIKTTYTGIISRIDLDILGSYALFNNELGDKYLFYKHGLPESEGVYYILSNKNNIIETNMPITLDDITENSFLSHITDILVDSTVVCNMASEESEIFKGHKFEVVDIEVPEFTNVIDYLNIKNVTEKTPVKTLKSLFGDCFTSSLIELDNAAFMEQYKDDEFAKQLLANRFDYYDTFKLPFTNDVLKGIMSGKIYSMLFSGASGTGKTTAAKVICDRIGLPLVTINISLNCEESDIFGCMVPNPYKEKPEDPEFIWQDGPATKAIRYGYALTFEEINGGRPGVLMKLNSLLDETRQIELSSGEIVKAHKNFRVFGTCNVGYEGTNRFNKALVNRFEIVKIFEEPEKEECFDIIKNRLGYTNLSNMETIWSVYKATKKYCEEQNLDVIISIRQLLNIFKLGSYYKNAKDAYIDIILNNAFLEEEEHLHNFIDTVLNVYPLTFKL